MRKYLVAIFIIAFVKYSNAQTGYGFVQALIIFKSGDSLNCFIERGHAYFDKVIYKMDPEGPESKLRTKEIQGIKTPHQVFENVPCQKKEKLMTVLQDGKISLYKFAVMETAVSRRSANGSVELFNENALFVLKKDGKYRDINKKNFKQVMNEWLSDSPDVLKKIDENLYGFHDIEDIVLEYNRFE